MLHELIFATHNQDKLKEISLLLGNQFRLLSLDDVKFTDEIPEDQDSLNGNALKKSELIYIKYKTDCFADDSGLEVVALKGRPGVHSARYSIDIVPEASQQRRAKENIKKLLKELENSHDRSAAFRTVICYISNGEIRYFEGKIEGKIISKEIGLNGFGYDPVFVPDGYTKTFAEMTLSEKNKISHRAIAISKFKQYLLHEKNKM
jgi:XTP/dITP diphosphohydrolase